MHNLSVAYTVLLLFEAAGLGPIPLQGRIDGEIIQALMGVYLRAGLGTVPTPFVFGNQIKSSVMLVGWESSWWDTFDR